MAWANTALTGDDAEIAFDGLVAAFRALLAGFDSHHIAHPGASRATAEHTELQWASIVLGNLKAAINGTHPVIWPIFSTVLIAAMTCAPYSHDSAKRPCILPRRRSTADPIKIAFMTITAGSMTSNRSARCCRLRRWLEMRVRIL